MLQPRQQQQQQQQQRFPPIAKPRRLKLLQDVTQQPYGIGVVRYIPNDTDRSSTKDDRSHETERIDLDPGSLTIERYERERAKRQAENTKEELDRVLKRVDNTLYNYDYAVQSTLIQHGMTREEVNSVEHVADIRELEYLLNDSLAKQRYKQRLMVFIVGQTEHASEKAKLLQQVGQFFVDQKQNFNAAEFNDYDDTGETVDEIETTLQSFDVKDCYGHVKSLGSRINELNEEIIQFLIQNTGTKQTKVMVERGKRKLAQVTKEAKEQLAELQSKLEIANAGMMAKDAAIQALGKDIETARAEVKTTEENQKKIQDELKKRETEIKFYKRRTNELEDVVSRYRNQIGDVSGYASATSQSEADDADDASRMNLETIDETESRYERESISSRTGKETGQATNAPAATTDGTANNAAKPTPAAPAPPPPPAASKSTKKSKTRDKRRSSFRSKKEAANQNNAEDPGEIYRRSQQLLESLLADKSENAPDLNTLFKPTRGVDLNNVTIDNLPTAFTNLRKFAIARVRELLKDLETKESANKETVQVLKQEFVEHKTTYEKERLLYFLTLNPDENTLQEEQNALAEKADNAHKLQMKAQKTAEEALNHLELFMVEQEKLDQQDVVRQTELVHRHSVVVNNMTGSNIAPPEHVEPVEELINDRLSPNPKRSTLSQNSWKKLTAMSNASSKQASMDEPKPTMFETAQTLKRMSSTTRKTPPLQTKSQRSNSIEQQQQQKPGTPLLRKTTQELLRKKSSIEQPTPQNNDRSPSLSRRISMAINDDATSAAKVATPQAYERTSSMQSRSLTRSNSINPAQKEQDKSSSGERSYHASAAQSRRVSIALNRSPVRAEDLERVLTTLVSEEIEALENYRRTSVKSRTSLREKYMSLLEEKKHELDDLKQQADVTLSRPTTSTRERKATESLEHSFHKQHSSSSPLSSSGAGLANTIKDNFSTLKHDHQQQTSLANSRPTTGRKKSPASPRMIQTDQYKIPFFHLYETIYNFRHSIMNLLEQNKFLPLADRADLIRQLSSTGDQNPATDFVDNSERALQDTVKILQTCLTTLTTTIDQNEEKHSQLARKEVETKTDENQSLAIIQQKESIINDLSQKYQQATEVLTENQRKFQEDLVENEKTIDNQQKLIQNYQRELMRLQGRLSTIENEEIAQPRIVFTRLDAERNEQILKQTVDNGKMSESTLDNIKDTMQDYVSLPRQQFSNIVKRYIQHRKANNLKSRAQNETLDNETKNGMQKMSTYYERRSGQISEHIASIRQHRSTLARKLTDTFGHLEHDSNIFLIRPVYSSQGRSGVQAFMENENPQFKELQPKRKSSETISRTDHSSTTPTDKEQQLFHTDQSFTTANRTSADLQSNQMTETADGYKPITELSRLQEFDIQRPIMSVSQNSVPLLTTNTNDTSGSLRTYVPLSRSSISGSRKSVDLKNPVLSTEISALSGTNPITLNDAAGGDTRQATPPLPPIKTSSTSNVSRAFDEDKKK
ncbi:unnamed protein product [Adineta ricciae]|uniref:Uncharacterized protein n=1 Tax=Adineta ricciae TaxID=249248 RepID=A0A814U757_ADIRI|nr:unnamed protein product [Adineta ricciae]CAF1169985.1 unnamed protein product [Adineta ricciae]